MSSQPQLSADLVHQHIMNRTGRRIRNLEVEVGPDCVVLRGRTPSFYIKQLAQHGALEALPSTRLENAIIVE
jgi:hypothetical protein